MSGMADVVSVQVRHLTGSIVWEHPEREVPVAWLIEQVETALKKQRQQPNAADAHLPAETKKSSRKYHVSGPTLILSGCYLLYLFAKNLLSAAAAPVSLAARIFSLPTIAAVGISLPIQRQAVDNFRKNGRPDMGFISTGLLYASILTGNVLASFTVFWLFNLSGWLEDRIRTRSRQAVRDMLAGRMQKAWLVRDGGELEVEVDCLQPGDVVSVRLGGVIAVDGVVVEGEALVAESLITGESMPIRKAAGDSVLAGTTVEDGHILVRAEKSGEDTRLASIIRLIKNADNDPGRMQLWSEQFSQAMVPFSLSLAALALLLTGNILQAMAVLIITCPCAIRLSTSVAVSSGMSLAAKNGILVKGGNYMELAGRVNVLVLDKTGTITDSASEIIGVQVLDRRYREQTVLQLAASVQKNWQHPLSRAVVEKAGREGLALLPCRHTEMAVGQGVAGEVAGQDILIGSLDFMKSHGQEIDTRKLRCQFSKSCLFVVKSGHLIGLLETRGKLRGDAAAGLEKIRAMGIKRLVLLTGDSQESAAGFAERFGFDEVLCQQGPEDKAEWIRKWKLSNPDDVVAMAGDGVNDTPAFSEADLSMAIGDGGADAALEYADIVLQQGGADQAAEILQIGRETLQRMKGSYQIAIGGNSAVLLLTTFGLISPVAGALIHNLITVSAVGHAASIADIK